MEALPKGVERVNIENWTKTREVDEVRRDGEERSINAVEFSDIVNVGVDDNEVQILTQLYDKVRYMKDIEEVKKLQNNEDDKISGNKVLRVINQIEGNYYAFKLSKISSWLSSNKNIEWESDNNNLSKIITWPCHNKSITTSSSVLDVLEYRILEGNFELTDEQIFLIRNKKVQAILGVSTNDDIGFQAIIPFNDLMSVFVNGNLTQLHYKTNKIPYSFLYMEENSNIPIRYEYLDIKSSSNDKYCNKGIHSYLSEHVNSNHLDLHILNKKDNTGYYQMMGDLRNDLNKNDVPKQNNIKLLIGKQTFPEEYTVSTVGGTSKLDLFLIEHPQFKVELNPYFIKENEKVYLDSDYVFSCGDNIYYDIEVTNTGKSFSLNDVNTVINFVVRKYNGQNIDVGTLKINKENITYKKSKEKPIEDITNNTQIYLNDKPNELTSLSSIELGDTITICSDKISYQVSEYNGIQKNIEYNYILEFNYLNDYFFYKYEGSRKYGVNQLKGRLDITVECEDNCSDYFYVKISGQNNNCNLKVEGNNIYKVYDLDLNKKYTVSLINSSTHIPVNNEVVTLTNALNGSSKSIKLMTSCRSNNYFTVRKIEGMDR